MQGDMNKEEVETDSVVCARHHLREVLCNNNESMN